MTDSLCFEGYSRIDTEVVYNSQPRMLEDKRTRSGVNRNRVIDFEGYSRKVGAIRNRRQSVHNDGASHLNLHGFFIRVSRKFRITIVAAKINVRGFLALT